MKALHGWLGAAALAAALGLAVRGPAPAPVVDVAAPPRAAVQALPLPVPPPVLAPRLAPVRAAAVVPASAELDRLIAAARRGDAQASLAAYRALAACAAPDGPGCPGLPASLLQERRRFLGVAVAAGLPAAQVDFYMEGPDALQALDPDALQAWRGQALTGLQAAAGHCERFAMGLLATLLDSGELAPRDPLRAITYAVADAELRHRPASDATLRERLAEPVDDATLAAARQLGQTLAAGCARS